MISCQMKIDERLVEGDLLGAWDITCQDPDPNALKYIEGITGPINMVPINMAHGQWFGTVNIGSNFHAHLDTPKEIAQFTPATSSLSCCLEYSAERDYIEHDLYIALYKHLWGHVVDAFIGWLGEPVYPSMDGSVPLMRTWQHV